MDLQDLQRCFLSTLISRFDDEAGRDKGFGECSIYCVSDLTYHVANALQSPYSNDDLACRLLVHSNENVGSQVVAGSKRDECGRYV